MSTKEEETPQRDSRITVKAADMSEAKQQIVLGICTDAINNYTSESDIAQFVKKSVEAIDSPTWHCIVGICFGSCVAHSQDNFIHLEVDFPKLDAFKDYTAATPKQSKCYILLFKTL